MQDKEFDQLFKDRFENAEMQPPVNLWAGIAQQLQPKRKRMHPAYWMAAAVVLLTITVALLMPETEKIRLQAPASQMAQSTIENNGSVNDGAMTADRITLNEDAAVDQVESTPLIIAPRLKNTALTANTGTKKDLKAVQPLINTHRLANQEPITEPVQTLAKQTLAKQDVVEPAKEVMMANADVNSNSTLDEVKETEQPERRGIRNVGDLVNFVVNKIDKREKKILQFETDDDNSSLVSINIGFIKFNKKSDK